MLTLAPERYTAGLCMVAKVNLYGVSATTVKQTRSTCIKPEFFQNVIFFFSKCYIFLSKKLRIENILSLYNNTTSA